MTASLRDYQQRAVDLTVSCLLDGDGSRLMIAAPTGTGKSLIALAIQAECRRRGVACFIFSPSPFILDGIAEKAGLRRLGGEGEASWQARREAAGLWTPLRYLHVAPPVPGFAVFDEAHHTVAPTWAETLSSFGKAIALTATPYRGSPSGTAALREEWGEPVWVLSLREAHQRGLYLMPGFECRPLLDDDKLDARGEEFVGADELVASRLDTIVDDVARAPFELSSALVMPSVETARSAADALGTRGIPTDVVVADTSLTERQRVFDEVLARRRLAVVVGVLSEGVDMPLQRLFVAAPIKSPVKAAQLYGRVTRPAAGRSVVVDYTRNIERFAYLFDGLMPLNAVRQVQVGFGGASKRAGGQRIEFERLRRYKPIPLLLANGLWATGYMLWYTGEDPTKAGEWAIIFTPTNPTPVVARRTHHRARWTKAPADAVTAGMEGYETSPARWPSSEKQLLWWRRSAASVGLDPTLVPAARQFAFLPALLDSYQHVRG